MGAFSRFAGFMTAVVGFALGVSYLLSVVGWGGQKQGESSPRVTTEAAPDPRIVGEWTKPDDDGELSKWNGRVKYSLVVTPSTINWSFVQAKGLGSHNENVSSRYRWIKPSEIELLDVEGQNERGKKATPVLRLDFIDDSQVIVTAAGVSWMGPFHECQGKFSRSKPVRPKAPPPDTSPIAVAKQQVQRIEQKLLKVESLRREAQKERGEMVAKLREMGIESAADLKENPRGQRMAENLTKLAAEIEGMDSQLASIDTELLKARSIVRRMEREQASISDDEMRALSAQLREAEAKTEAAPRPITPLDVNAALEAALKKKSSPREKR